MNYSRITKLSIAISLALAGANVSAGVDIDAPIAVTYATETNASALVSGSTPCDLNISGKVGVLIPGSGVSSTITRYLRFDLTGDAKFAGTAPSLTTSVGTATTTLVSGGTGFNFVIFSVATAVSAPVAATDTFDLTVTSISISDTETPVQLNYSVHTNDVSASQGINGTAVEKSTPNISYITYSSGLVFGVSPSNLTASVEANFVEFSSSANATATQGSLGQLNFAVSPVCGPSGSTVLLSDLLDTNTTLEFVGDFNLIQDVAADGTGLGTFGDTTTTGVQNGAINFFDNATCTTGAVLTSSNIEIASDGSQVIFSGLSGLSLDGKYLCLIRPAGSTVKILPDDTYELNLKPASGTGFTVAQVTAPTGDVLRDGTVLEAPYFTLTPGYISRFILSHLNPGGADAAFTIELQTDEGNVITPNAAGPFPYDAAEGTFSGTLAAGTILQINATDLVTSFSAKNRGSVTFTFVASNNDIQGIYQAVNLATGEVSNIPLPRPGGGSGK